MIFQKFKSILRFAGAVFLLCGCSELAPVNPFSKSERKDEGRSSTTYSSNQPSSNNANNCPANTPQNQNRNRNKNVDKIADLVKGLDLNKLLSDPLFSSLINKEAFDKLLTEKGGLSGLASDPMLKDIISALLAFQNIANTNGNETVDETEEETENENNNAETTLALNEGGVENSNAQQNEQQSTSGSQCQP